MANYYLEVKNVSRGKSHSITRRASYIFGEKLRDNYRCENCYKNRSDVLFREVFLPHSAPSKFGDIQTLCDEIDKAEKRYDARTAKELIGSLPNELNVSEIVKIVMEFISVHFTKRGLAVMAAIHEGRNVEDPSHNNSHVHILVTTRTLGENGFNPKKLRDLDQKKNVGVWRESWAKIQNRAYEHNKLDIRVSHECLEVQGIDREPIPRLSCIDMQREKKGQRTKVGDRKREVLEKNRQKLLEKERQNRERELEHSMSRSR